MKFDLYLAHINFLLTIIFTPFNFSQHCLMYLLPHNKILWRSFLVVGSPTSSESLFASTSLIARSHLIFAINAPINLKSICSDSLKFPCFWTFEIFLQNTLPILLLIRFHIQFFCICHLNPFVELSFEWLLNLAFFCWIWPFEPSMRFTEMILHDISISRRIVA